MKVMSEIFFLVLFFAAVLVVSGSDSCMRSAACPCGFSGKTFRFCFDGVAIPENPCQRLSNCETCRENYPYCVTCAAGRSGDLCMSESDIQESEMECVPLEPLAHGKVIRTRKQSDFHDFSDVENPVGTRLKYSCNKGYMLIGEVNVECLAHGFWSSSPPECVEEPAEESEMECVPLEPLAHGTMIRISKDLSIKDFLHDVNPVGTRIKFSCNEGYVLEGSDNIECLTYGFWSTAPPECAKAAAVICNHPGMIQNGEIDDSQLSESGGKFIPGTRVSYSCEEGFTLHGETTIFCLVSGQWSAETPKCERTGVISRDSATCSHPGVDENGEIVDLQIEMRAGPFAIGTRLTYTCKSGFTLFGEKSVYCLNTGSWSAPAPRCEPPELLNEISEDSEMECFPMHHIPHGRILHSQSVDLPTRMSNHDSADARNPVGTRLQISCEEGYTRIGPESIECLPNGFWNAAPPSCLEGSKSELEKRQNIPLLRYFNLQRSQPDEGYIDVACVPPDILENGKVLRTGGNQSSTEIKEDIKVTNNPIGTRLQYSCNPGYKLVGQAENICEETGSWSSGPPTCVLDKP